MNNLTLQRTFWAGAACALVGPAAWLCGLGAGAQALAVAVGGLALMALAANPPARRGRGR
ncbi:hypothetical protein Deba_3276 [Desulfarculus baarsii DSM 2075]|uniref:Uncharacterized protein n=1 Tax=Desulfarculus baarsii (strain ATCC 33931 / DSM 2075 / LMG 7858 / VKM B-1802 / 2st14) TaxID=644282 RepID=E1QM44_DESB2|nr:hypothetical protein [Desulfarculus baarsii]ADK86629.1 hypothetical protein Deba_3276 [Desulfarculus baarsii DSM 2075]